MPRTMSPSANTPRPDRLPAAEREQLARQARAAIHRLLDLGRLVARRIVGRELHQQQVRRAHDAHQDVVEVVRDAAGQPPDRFELLRLPQLLLERAPLGDVADEPGQHRAAVAAESRDRQLERELAAVGAQAGQLDLPAGERPAAGRHVLVQRADLLRAIGRRQQQLDVAAEDVEPRVAEHLLGRRVELADVQLLSPS